MNNKNNQKVENVKQQEVQKKNNLVNENLNKQYQFLQQTVGNQKVLEMMRMGILPSSMPKSSQNELNQSEDNRSKLEEKQINKDREALLPVILKKLDEKKDKLDILKNKKEGIPIFANINIELVYVSIEGDKPLNLYHFTDLKNVDFSYENKNEKKDINKKNRGYTIPITFSFMYDKNEKNLNNLNKNDEMKDDKNKDKENVSNKVTNKNNLSDNKSKKNTQENSNI